MYYSNRVVSGMRPTGMLHLGHYHGVLKNWIKLQSKLSCLFFVADWHALTTHYKNSSVIEANILEMVIDWLAVGIDPSQAILFIQSHVPEHAELYLLLSMIVPLRWLEHVPSYKDKKNNRNLATCGFFNYSLLQAADILIYRAGQVPVGEDQIPHIEMTRKISRRFNYLYGKEINFEKKVYEVIKKLDDKYAKLYLKLRMQFQKFGNQEALKQAKNMLENLQNLSITDYEYLFSYLEKNYKLILTEPCALLTNTPHFPGLDGTKMSKSYGNAITLREDKKIITKKIRMMLTDPQRIRRSDIGDPSKCPVWQFHIVYSDISTKQWINQSCRSANIGCVECKQLIIDAILKEQEPMLERAQQYIDNPSLVRMIIANGCDNARKLAKDTINDVREAMKLNYLST